MESTKKLSILIVLDYPIILSVYKKILQKRYKYEANIKTCISFNEAVEKLNSEFYNIILIDIDSTCSKDIINFSLKHFLDTLKTSFATLKIILILTEKKHTILNILKSPHDALLIKKDITKKTLLNSFEDILNNNFFYSVTAMELKQKIANQKIDLDEIDVQILQNLSIGIKTKNLIQKIPLSLSAIEKRKNKIKTLFDTETDEALLEKARFYGLIPPLY